MVCLSYNINFTMVHDVMVCVTGTRESMTRKDANKYPPCQSESCHYIIHRIMSERTGINTYQLNRIHTVVFKIFSNSYMVQSNRTVSLFNRCYMFRSRSTIIRPQIKYLNSRLKCTIHRLQRFVGTHKFSKFLQ